LVTARQYKFLADSGRTRMLPDCGLFQGARELRRRNWEPLGFPPAGIDAVILTHAHLDHCRGRGQDEGRAGLCRLTLPFPDLAVMRLT
jgi:metal-dependent hydrolase (beta-lactamase superfamily II)